MRKRTGGKKPLKPVKRVKPPKPQKVKRALFKRKKSDGHPKFIQDTSNGQHGYTGVTSHPKTFGKRNHPLHKNPDPRSTEKAYARDEYKHAPVNDFKDDPKYDDWTLDPRDKKLMTKIKTRKNRNKK